MESVATEQGYSGYTWQHKAFGGTLRSLSSLDVKQQVAKRLTYNIEEVIFVVFVTLLIPIVFIVTSLVVSLFYLHHVHVQAMAFIDKTAKKINKGENVFRIDG